MLHILTPPESLLSAHDIVGTRTATALSQAGIPAIHRALWPDGTTLRFNSGQIPYGRRIFRKWVAPFCARRVLNKIPPKETAWILGFASPYAPDAALEQRLVDRGCGYIFHVMDDWLSIPELREGTILRSRMAQMVVVPTPALLRHMQEELPDCNTVRLEEPVDVDRLNPSCFSPTTEKPMVVWCGGVVNLRLLAPILHALEGAYAQIPFHFRIISGTKPAQLALSIPWEWKPYDYAGEASLLAGAVAGLAPIEDTPYMRCKGIFKVKTYMAAGVPVVGSDVGYQQDLVEEGVTGFRVRTPEEWESAILRLVREPQLATAMGQAARKTAVARYSHAAVAPAWAEALRPFVYGTSKD